MGAALGWELTAQGASCQVSWSHYDGHFETRGTACVDNILSGHRWGIHSELYALDHWGNTGRPYIIENTGSSKCPGWANWQRNMDNNWKVSWVNQPYEMWTRHVEGDFANCGLFAAYLRINDFYDVWWSFHN